MSTPGTPAEDGVRLVPDGCDYLLRGVSRGRVEVDSNEILVPATAPGGASVVARIPPDAPGLSVEDGPEATDAEKVLRLHNVAVPASRVFPRS